MEQPQPTRQDQIRAFIDALHADPAFKESGITHESLGGAVLYHALESGLLAE